MTEHGRSLIYPTSSIPQYAARHPRLASSSTLYPFVILGLVDVLQLRSHAAMLI
jgi:hypothetical protein